MSAVTTLLFDVDGVLIRGDLASSYFERTYHIPHEKLITFYRGPFLDCLVGKKDMYEVLPKYLVEWQWPKTPEAFVTEWFEYEQSVDEELRACIQSLRVQGLTCYLATNQERHRAQFMLDKLGFKDSFDGLYASSHLGSAKPDAEFFVKILQRLHITDPSQVLFWDDMPKNVDAAVACGLCAEVYTDFAAFETTMRVKYHLGADSK